MLDRAPTANAPAEAAIAVTFTKVPAAAQISALSAITGGKRTPAVRLVVSDLNEVSGLAQTVDGSMPWADWPWCRSATPSSWPGMSMTQYRERLDVLISALSAADAWGGRQ